MVEKTDRTTGSGGPRSADGRRFEVFVREEESDPLRHVGTVAAPTPDVAHEEASKLFAWYARDVWVCPAEETHRYSAESLAADDRSSGGESTESAAAASPADGDDEPRVYEETEGTPTVTCGGAPVEDDSESIAPDDASTPEGDR
ncbi:Htur_1727 family rSAM-partnered candidate RiPP [Halorubrum sp. CBA1229]|jgi:rSAM-partnered protein|uniref:Htur_1727 family rSAM-partnered candidate RiPP n=1 Tax=Halorubrum sp. CBA1229 TaxID=1853699 RepID=UPI000F415210|nr:Htur_1727 family rSAM-partnered candidate RiPP [Halorubrum sp. CBA1229]QKY17572.1 rSAM-partnered protein [Halorubrum sp. CBA1229]